MWANEDHARTARDEKTLSKKRLSLKGRINVVERLAFAEAIGFDPREAIKRLAAVKPD